MYDTTLFDVPDVVIPIRRFLRWRRRADSDARDLARVERALASGKVRTLVHDLGVSVRECLLTELAESGLLN